MQRWGLVSDARTGIATRVTILGLNLKPPAPLYLLQDFKVLYKYCIIIIIRPHRSTTYVGAACCYRPSSMVCQSVCLLVCQSVTLVRPAKTAGCNDRDAAWVKDSGGPKLVSLSLTSLFSTNMAISETKGQGWRVILTHWRKSSDILTSTLAAFLFSSHPKKGKGSRGSFKLLR